MKLTLVRPSIEWKEEALRYRQAHFDHGETVINGSELFDKTECFETWLASVTHNADPQTVTPNWVLTDTFFAVDPERNKIVGMIDLRHTLNNFLADFGHSGYSVHPDERRKGYATAMLQQICKIAKAAGLPELHLSVERSNTASVRTIVKNGGVYARSFSYQGDSADVYKITLTG